MPFQIGREPRAGTETPEALLLACHERIRSFLALAVRLTTLDSGSVTDAEVADAAAAANTYFTIALPLHVRDEEESVVPRLRGTGRHVDEALATMRVEHRAHERSVAALVTLLGAIAAAPARLAQEREALAFVAHELEQGFASHLAIEEDMIFPQLRTLSDDARSCIVAEMRARRGVEAPAR